jgi:hypothetical protein
LNQAYVLLEKALEFNPNYDAARGAMKQTQVLLTHFTGQATPDYKLPKPVSVPADQVSPTTDHPSNPRK